MINSTEIYYYGKLYGYNVHVASYGAVVRLHDQQFKVKEQPLIPILYIISHDQVMCDKPWYNLTQVWLKDSLHVLTITM